VVTRLEMIEQKCLYAMRSAARLRRYEEMAGASPEIVEHERRLLERLLREIDLIRSLDDDHVLFEPGWQVDPDGQSSVTGQTQESTTGLASSVVAWPNPARRPN
jgi:hypothetical protein